MKIPTSITTLIIGILVTLISIWAGQNHHLLPVDASQEASRIDQLFNTMMGISVGLFLIIQGALIYALFAFRRRQGDTTDANPVHGNVPLEIVWTAIPAVIILWLAIYSFDVYNQVDRGGFVAPSHVAHAHTGEPLSLAIAAPLPPTVPDAVQDPSIPAHADPEQGTVPVDPATATVRNQDIPPRRDAPDLGVVAPTLGPETTEIGSAPALEVKVTGLQFAWIFTYPDSGIISGELHLPLNRQVKLDIAANDVIHAFWVPEFRLKQDAIPGRETHMRFTPNRLGEYPVICAELCGAYHGAMKTRVIVQTPEDYDAWKQAQQVASATSLAPAVALSPASSSPAAFLTPHLVSMGLPTEISLAGDRPNSQLHHASASGDPTH